MKNFILCAALMLLPLAVSVAQERSAGSAVETQMTWTTLTTIVNSTKAYAEGVNSRVDQVVVCSRKGMVYAPGTGADTDGCLNPKKTVDTTDYDRLVACNDQRLVFDKSSNACVQPTVSVPTPSCSTSFVKATVGRKGWNNTNEVASYQSQGYQCVDIERRTGSTGSSSHQEYDYTDYACVRVRCS